MCGIAGFMPTAPGAPDSGRVDAMAAALGHRGPDGSGRLSREGIALVQTRLAIIDVAGGNQPLHEPNGAALVANGEIYNYRELAKDLGDGVLRTDSDCEVPLPLYRRDGLDFVHRLRGMYALALHDPVGARGPGGRLILARDPFGIKPLYYAETPDGLAFASEPQALLAAGLVARHATGHGDSELLNLQFTTGGDSVFAGVRRVLPGETLVVERGRVVERHKRPALPADGDGALPMREATALESLDQVLTDSVDKHQRADVPYGMFLSGGLDSSALLALMARLNDRPVVAFTAGFPGTGVRDERAHAADVARAVGAEHHEVPFDEDDFWRLLPRVAAALDDPAADYAVLPTFKLAEAASRHVKVILSGEGGDEMLAGYGRYRHVLKPWPFRKRARRRGALEGLGLLRDSHRGWREGIAAAEREEMLPGRTPLQVAQAVDCVDWLPNDLLLKLDRCLMAHGVEGRVPFLDPDVASFAFRLPDHLKVWRNQGKWLLRRWLERHLPESRPFSPKRGFTVPVGQWIGRRGNELAPLVAENPAVAAMCRPDRVRALFRELAERPQGGRRGFAAWVLLFYALWHRAHVAGHGLADDGVSALMDVRG